MVSADVLVVVCVRPCYVRTWSGVFPASENLVRDIHPFSSALVHERTKKKALGLLVGHPNLTPKSTAHLHIPPKMLSADVLAAPVFCLLTLVLGLTVIEQTGFHECFPSVDTAARFRGIIPRAHCTGGTCSLYCHTESPLRAISHYQPIGIVKPILTLASTQKAKEETKPNILAAEMSW